MELRHFSAPRVLPAVKPSLFPQDHTWTILRSFVLPWITVHKFFLQPVDTGENSSLPVVRAEGGRKLNEMFYVGSRGFVYDTPRIKLMLPFSKTTLKSWNTLQFGGWILYIIFGRNPLYIK